MKPLVCLPLCTVIMINKKKMIISNKTFVEEKKHNFDIRAGQNYVFLFEFFFLI